MEVSLRDGDTLALRVQLPEAQAIDLDAFPARFSLGPLQVRHRHPRNPLIGLDRAGPSQWLRERAEGTAIQRLHDLVKPGQGGEVIADIVKLLTDITSASGGQALEQRAPLADFRLPGQQRGSCRQRYPQAADQDGFEMLETPLSGRWLPMAPVDGADAHHQDRQHQCCAQDRRPPARGDPGLPLVSRNIQADHHQHFAVARIEHGSQRRNEGTVLIGEGAHRRGSPVLKDREILGRRLLVHRSRRRSQRIVFGQVLRSEDQDAIA